MNVFTLNECSASVNCTTYSRREKKKVWPIFSASTMQFDQNVVVDDEKNKSKQNFLLRIFTGPGGEGTLQIIG